MVVKVGWPTTEHTSTAALRAGKEKLKVGDEQEKNKKGNFQL